MNNGVEMNKRELTLAKSLLQFVDEIGPQIGKIALQDYANYNEMCLLARSIVREDEVFIAAENWIQEHEEQLAEVPSAKWPYPPGAKEQDAAEIIKALLLTR